jgi:hypothetical protein
MKLQPIGSNQNVLTLDDGTRVLFSYETPVAFERMGRFSRTSRKYSVTTSKHINAWVGSNCSTVPQDEINAIVGR